MRRHPIGQIQHHLVDITPAPSFRRIVALDDRMLGRMKMFGCVMIGGFVAASDMAAGAAYAQVHPDITGLETLFAAERARGDVANAFQMRAMIGHSHLLRITEPV